MNQLFIDKNSFGIRVALTENGKLVQIFMDPKSGESWVGKVLVGQIKTILPNGFAFVDIGAEKNAFMNLRSGHGLKAGQALTVQVEKDPVGTKGMFVTQEVKLKGKYIILFFDQKQMIGISKKIDDAQRKRIKKVIKGLLPEGFGAVARTTCGGQDIAFLKEELKQEIETLQKTLTEIEKSSQYLVPRTVLFPKSKSGLGSILVEALPQDIQEIYVSGKPSFYRDIAEDVQKDFPNYDGQLIHYNETDNDLPNIFDAHSISSQIKNACKKQVDLPCGGFITIEETEALVVTDVNTGSNVGDKNYAATILETNLEAAAELAFQIRLRNLSGVIIVDFINMASKTDRVSVLDTLRQEFKKDRTPIDNLSETGLGGLVQFTRRKTRPPLSYYF